MLDVYQIILWSITYGLVIIAGILSWNEQKVSIPYVAGVLDFAWEASALCYSKGFWGHILWLALDAGIVYFGFRYCKSNRNKALYAISILVSTLLLLYIFTVPNGMLFSVFVIDFILAVCFLTDRKKLSPKLKVSIAFTKLLGDLFAGMHYAPDSALVAALAVLTFFCNIAYLCLCIQENDVQRMKKTGNRDTNMG